MSEDKRIGKPEVFPLTPERWMDFEMLFGPHGASSGCWCMYWRFPAGGDYSATKGEPHRLAMYAMVNSGKIPGLLAYVNGIPVAWVAVAPRSEYLRLEKSKSLFPVDGEPVWSIPCFFVHRNFRHRHLLATLINAAADYARTQGASFVEAYPIDIQQEETSGNLFTGILQVFIRCGFTEVARRGSRPIVRKSL